MDIWVYDGPQGQASRAEYFDPRSGQLFQEFGMTATPTNYETYINVYFFAKTWSKQSYQGPKPSETGCGFSLSMGWVTFPDMAAGLRKDLACGALSSEGMQQVDGVYVFKLVSVQRSRLGPKTLGTITTIIWVDPATYLPVRLTTQWTRPIVSVPMRYDFRWLPPTSANLARSRCGSRPGSRSGHEHLMEAAPDPFPGAAPPRYHPARACAPPFADPSGDTPDSVSWEDPDPDVMVTT